MPDLPDGLTRLEERVEALEQRVAALECSAAPSTSVAVRATNPEPVMQTNGEPSSSITTAALSVFGKAMLGIAGAYALRAVAESEALPLPPVSAVAILYALGWLVIASRTRAGDWLRSTIYACTAALILAPMLWELTVRFKILTAWETAAVLGLFVVVASVRASRRGFIPGVWVNYGTATMIALGLAGATHEVVPFVAVLLLLVLITEYRAMRCHERGVRVLAALAADAAICELIYIYGGPQNARAEYPAIGRFELIAPGALLFFIFGLGVIVRTVLTRKEITWFEAIQTTVAFLLAACGVMYFGPRTAVTALGIFCVALSGVGYTALLKWFDREKGERNSLVFATWSGALFIAGALIGVPAWLRAAWLGAAAPIAVFAGARWRRPALEAHGVVFLIIAATISGLLVSVWNALAGAGNGAPTWDMCVVSMCAAACYITALADSRGNGTAQAIQIAFASLASAVMAAVLVSRMVSAMAIRMIPEAHHLAFIRTLALCVMAIGMAVCGAYWRRLELARIAYGVMVLLGVKLVFEDLRHGHLAFVAGSIFLFAMTLIVVPRAQRVGQRI